MVGLISVARRTYTNRGRRSSVSSLMQQHWYCVRCVHSHRRPGCGVRCLRPVKTQWLRRAGRVLAPRGATVTLRRSRLSGGATGADDDRSAGRRHVPGVRGVFPSPLPLGQGKPSCMRLLHAGEPAFPSPGKARTAGARLSPHRQSPTPPQTDERPPVPRSAVQALSIALRR